MGVRFSAPVQTGPGAHPASCMVGTGSFRGVKSGWGVTLTPHPFLVPWSRKSRAIPLLPLWAVWSVQSLSVCTSVHFTFYWLESHRETKCFSKKHVSLICSYISSENWALTASQRRRTEAAEMKLLRPLAGYTLYDHKTNYYICRELQITGILDKIDEYRQNRLQHLQRMPQNRIPLESYYYRPQGRRTIGRPKKRWREQL